ncbi:MAG TPA: enoyl-CoA hydratase/isomerase family protein [Burkholderiales bacterium]
MQETKAVEQFPEGVTLARAGGVAEITLDRPADMNRLLPDVLARLHALVERLREDAATHAVVITGGGEQYFSMGILNPAIRASFSKEQIIELVMLANRVFDAVEALPQIVIAAINGRVLAGAVELALACDIRYCAAHATLQMPEAAWGGFPGAGAPVRLPALVGRARALELICATREIGAQEMERYGIVQGVYPGAEFRDSVRAIAQRIAQNGPLATRGAKKIANARLAPGFQHSRELSDSLRRALEWSADVDEAMAAQAQGRKPVFHGH